MDTSDTTTPVEVIVAMGFPQETVLAKDFFDAHRQAGNALTIGHAVLGLTKVDAVLGPLSLFVHCMTSPNWQPCWSLDVCAFLIAP